MSTGPSKKRLALWGHTEDGALVAMTAEPFTCGCGRVAFAIWNRHGKTRCGDCDMEYLNSLKTKETP